MRLWHPATAVGRDQRKAVRLASVAEHMEALAADAADRDNWGGERYYGDQAAERMAEAARPMNLVRRTRA